VMHAFPWQTAESTVIESCQFMPNLHGHDSARSVPSAEV
jgi:hypothetical protein